MSAQERIKSYSRSLFSLIFSSIVYFARINIQNFKENGIKGHTSKTSIEKACLGHQNKNM